MYNHIIYVTVIAGEGNEILLRVKNNKV